MTIKFHPNAGSILICNYDPVGLGGEMVKSRPCVVISPRLRRRNGLCSIVPLSTTQPHQLENYHYFLKLDRPMPKPFDSPEMWVKCDMIATVSSERLHLIRAGRGSDGKRKYLEIKVLDKDLQGIRNGIRYALGLIDS